MNENHYRHEALLYADDDGYLAGTVDFVRDGMAADEPVMVAVPGPKLGLIRDALGPDGRGVRFVDMTALGHNPARIIPAWLDFAAEHGARGRSIRGIGEPIWAGRRPAEIAESQLHEALLNRAVAPSTRLQLRCPYDVTALPADVVATARRTHPVLSDVTGAQTGGPARDDGLEHTLFATDLPEPVADPEVHVYAVDGAVSVRGVVARRAAEAGLDADRSDSLALTMHELAINSLRHADGWGTLRVWAEPGALVCEVRDSGQITDVLVGRRAPALDREGGRGVWLANQLCDLVQIRSGERGTTVRVHTWL